MSTCGLGGVFSMRSAIRRVDSSRLGFLATMIDQPYPDEFKDYIPEPYLIAIGKVCVNWGMLEMVMDHAIGKLARFDLYDSRGAVVTAHTSWPQKMDVLEALVGELRTDYPHLAKFDAIKPLLKKAQEGRNRVVHGRWGEEDGKVHLLRTTARGKLKSSIDLITIEDIQAIAMDIGRAGAGLTKLVLNQ
jgi:hypothetical protein